MSFLKILLGRPLASSEERAEQIGAVAGVPIFGLDALGSAAYGPEAALTLLIPLGLLGLNFVLPLTAAITILLIIVYFSYRQTIAAYPQGGGSYTVAHENLGTFAGLLAGSALLIDYALDAAVGISAGVGALTSAAPALHPHTLSLCLAALAILVVVNLRGSRETSLVFMAPTCFFLFCMFVQILWGLSKSIAAHGHPTPVIPPPHAAATAAASAWLLLKAFASGCTALTGVEAVSNGVRAFREPTVKYARQCLTIIIVALGFMICGLAVLVRAYGIVATDPKGVAYQSLLSMLFHAVAGNGWFYYASIGSVLALLVLSANTAFADFPRVCRVLASDHFLPTSFANRGRRLVYAEGILVLAVLTAVLLIVFGGITDRLIPLFAVGAFLAFTMSQAGMVIHWKREGGNRSRTSLAINATGAVATGLTTCIIIVAKFMEGAWVTAIAIPSLIAFMYSVRRYYANVNRQIAIEEPLEATNLLQPIIIVAMHDWNRITRDALHFAMTLSKDIKVIHAAEDTSTEDFARKWADLIETPARQANLPVPELTTLESPYRFVVSPLVEYIVKIAKEHPNRRIIAVVPEVVECRWYHYFLHTQRASLLKARLLMSGHRRVSVLNVPWHLKDA